MLSAFSTAWRLFPQSVEHFETAHIPWPSPTPPSLFSIHWWLSPSQSRPWLMWNRGCVLQHPPYLSASTLAWGSPLLLPPRPTYFLNYLFVCLLSAWTYSPLLFWLPLMILLSQIWQMGTPMPFQHTPSFFSYVPHEFIQKAPIPVHLFRVSLPSSLSASFFLHLQREPCLPDPRYILSPAQSHGPRKIVPTSLHPSHLNPNLPKRGLGWSAVLPLPWRYIVKVL